MNTLTEELLKFIITNPEVKSYYFDNNIIWLSFKDRDNLNKRLNIPLPYGPAYELSLLFKLGGVGKGALSLRFKYIEQYKNIPVEIKLEYDKLMKLIRNKSPERLLLELNNE